jgi:ribosome-binding factor A
MTSRTLTGKRPTRVGELLRERIALIILHRCADPRLKELTITQVEMSPDLKQARVFYAARSGSGAEEVQAALKKALGFIKQELAREHLLRVMPELLFLPDEGLERAARLEELFQHIREPEEVDQ